MSNVVKLFPPQYDVYGFRFEISDSYPEAKEAIMSASMRLSQTIAVLKDAGNEDALMEFEKSVADVVHKMATDALNENFANQSADDE